MPQQLYVSLQNDDRIARFAVDAETGRLTHIGDVEVPDGPAPMGLSPNGRHLYVGLRGEGGLKDGSPLPQFALVSYDIDPATGDLERTGRVQLLGEPAYIATDRRGRFLLSAHYQAGHCAVHPIDESGAVGGEAIEWRDTNSGAHSIQTDPSNRFAFVPHISQGSAGLLHMKEGRRTAANAIFQFRFDQESGRLTPNEPARVEADGPIGPRHFCFHPTKDIAYVINEQGACITVYDLDPERGTLTARQMISTVPEGYNGRQSSSQIRIHPEGRFLWATNRGHDSLASFAVDDRGELQITGWVSAEPRPRAICLDPTGRFMYVGAVDTGNVQVYRVDEESGRLELVESVHAGELPMWLIIAEVGS